MIPRASSSLAFRKPWLITTTTLLIVICVYIWLQINKKPVAPPVPVVYSCKKVVPGMRRIGEQYGVQFDVPIDAFTFHEGDSDTPPVVHGVDVTLKNKKCLLAISWGSASDTELMKPKVDPALIYSGPAEKRKVFDSKGDLIGEDSWGYLDNGGRWRRVRFVGEVLATYGSRNGGDVPRFGIVKQNEASFFDQVINSVCIMR